MNVENGKGKKGKRKKEKLNAENGQQANKPTAIKGV